MGYGCYRPKSRICRTNQCAYGLGVRRTVAASRRSSPARRPTSHAGMDSEDRDRIWITDDLVRVSCGVEASENEGVLPTCGSESY
jgi:hypothetical protein